jgi:hypothetical protein
VESLGRWQATEETARRTPPSSDVGSMERKLSLWGRWLPGGSSDQACPLGWGDLKKSFIVPGIVEHSYNPSNWKVEA